MSRNPVANATYAFVVWLPILAIAAGILWVLAVGVMQLEIDTYGTEFFVGNQETPNMPAWKMAPSGAEGAGINGGGNADMLLDALNSGDTAQMQSALAQYEASTEG